MTECPECHAAMVYRYNLNWARTPFGSEYVWVCVVDSTHTVENGFYLRDVG